MENEYLAKAIKKLRPEAEFSFQSGDYSTIQWIVLEGQAPTDAEIAAATKEIKAEIAATEKAEAAKKANILERLGITEEEAKLLLA